MSAQIQNNTEPHSSMKTSQVMLASLALLASGASLSAQNFELSSVTIANGGGTSSGGNYVFNDTIGQPVTAPMSGGAFTFQGGFWNLVSVVPTPGAPTLGIRPAPGDWIVVSWPSAVTGFVLQRANSLSVPAVWTDVTTPVVVVGGYNTVKQLIAPGQRYYRLRQVTP